MNIQLEYKPGKTTWDGLEQLHTVKYNPKIK